MSRSLRFRLLLRSPLWRTLGLLLLAGLLLLGWNRYYYEPRTAYAEELDRQLELATERADQAMRNARALPGLHDQYARLSASLNRYRGALRPELDIPELIARLSRYAGESGLAIEKMDSVKPRAIAPRTQGYALKLDLSGRYPGYVAFLGLLAGDPQIMVVDPPELKASASTGVVAATLTVTALYDAGVLR